MVYKKIKKASVTLTTIVLSLLIVIAIYFGMFLYLTNVASESNVNVDSKYSAAYTKMQEAQNTIDENNKEIEAGFDSITEADKNFFGLNGLKGLLAVLKAPLIYISTTKETSEALISSTDEGIMPPWLKSLIYIGITVLIVLLLLAAFKGEPGKI